jgi:hypothetical protein
VQWRDRKLRRREGEGRSPLERQGELKTEREGSEGREQEGPRSYLLKFNLNFLN